MKIFNIKKFYLGEGHVTRFTIIEIKCLFSIYIHIFNTKKQDRFHTHAFSAVAIMFRGWYKELVSDKIGDLSNLTEKTIRPGIRYIPAKYNHKIMESSGNTITLLITGPYSWMWTEEYEDRIDFKMSPGNTLFKSVKKL